MTRLLIHVEGQTEETFVNNILRPHLLTRGFHTVAARLIGDAPTRDRRGGIPVWKVARKGIIRRLKEDGQVIVTTMVDYYALPKDWPGRAAAAALPFARKAVSVETALADDIAQAMDKNFRGQRFLPYVMMHEFESMLFSDCGRFAEGIGQPALAQEFQKIRNQFASPEEINDDPTTAPSKRIGKLVTGYEKPLLGNLGALEIGLDKIRAECPHFRQWLEKLENVLQ